MSLFLYLYPHPFISLKNGSNYRAGCGRLMTFLPLGSLKPLSTPDMPNKTIYWPPVLYLRDLLGNWLVRELGSVCIGPPTGSKQWI